ncbi:hypothetical protein ACLOJK_008008 [Asimina triloba]
MKKSSREKEKKATLDACRDEVFGIPYGGGDDDDDDDDEDDIDIARRESLRTAAEDEQRRQMYSRSQSVCEAGESSSSKSGRGLFRRFRNVFSASGRGKQSQQTKHSTPASYINLEEEDIPHHVADSPYFQVFVDAAAKTSSGVKAPYSYEIDGKYANTYEEADEIRVGLKNVIKRLEPDIDRQINAINEIQIYELGMGSFGEPIAKAAIRKSEAGE